jgi:signal transduction histidine kinase
MLLSLVKSDHPKAAPALQDVLSALDRAMESVRELSQELNASPVDRLGLRHALLRFSERDARVSVDYSATARMSRETASALYEAAAAAICAAQDAEAKNIRVSVSGSAGVKVRVADDGRASRRKTTLAVPMKLAAAAGLAVAISTIKGTIVSISHAVRRSAGR